MKGYIFISLLCILAPIMAIGCSNADGCKLGACDGALYPSVKIWVRDYENKLVCCPSQVFINGHNAARSDFVGPDGVLGNEDCDCELETQGNLAFIVIYEDLLELDADNTVRVEMDGYLPWEKTFWVDCECDPNFTFSAMVEPE